MDEDRMDEIMRIESAAFVITFLYSRLHTLSSWTFAASSRSGVVPGKRIQGLAGALFSVNRYICFFKRDISQP